MKKIALTALLCNIFCLYGMESDLLSKNLILTPYRIKKRTELFLRSEEFKQIPQCPNQILKDYLFVNDFQEKVNAKNKMVANNNIYLEYNTLCRLHDEHICNNLPCFELNEYITQPKDFHKNKNYRVFLVESHNKVATVTGGSYLMKALVKINPTYFFDIYDNANKKIKNISLPDNPLSSIDCFTVSGDNKLFFTIGSDFNRKKNLVIHAKKKNSSVQKEKKFQPQFDFTPRPFNSPYRKLQEYVVKDIKELPNSMNVRGIEFHTNGKLALLKQDGGVLFMDLNNVRFIKDLLEKYPKQKKPKIMENKPKNLNPSNSGVSNINKESQPTSYHPRSEYIDQPSNYGSLYVTFGIFALTSLAWYYKPGSIVDTFKSFFGTLWQRRIEN